MQLEIEREALRKETDAASRERLEQLEKELADLKEQSDALKEQWQREKAGVQGLRDLQGADRADRRSRSSSAERAADYEPRGRAALRHAARPRAEAARPSEEQLGDQQEAGALLKEEVDEEDIAEVVSRWTGVPGQPNA